VVFLWLWISTRKPGDMPQQREFQSAYALPIQEATVLFSADWKVLTSGGFGNRYAFFK
jgi:hypothetical protein